MMGRAPLKTSDWVRRAIAVHGKTYDYSNSNYMGSHSPIKIICRTHGEFAQRAAQHLQGQGCKKCVVDSQKKSKSDFVRDAQKVHGNFYDYSKVEIVSTHELITILCPIHGEFQQLPIKHQSGQGCKKCGRGDVWNTEEFLREARIVHGRIYDYKDVQYTRSADPVVILCKKCSKTFLQRPSAHLRGAGCPSCAGNMKWTDDAFRELLSEAHNGEIVALDEYGGSGVAIRVKHICGHEWKTTPNRVVTQRKGCKKCADDQKRMTEADFLHRLAVRHNDEIVALEKYVQSKTRIRVRHIKCGKEWETEPRNVLRCGCHDCANRKTDAEFREELRKVHCGEVVALERYQTVRHSILVRHSCGKEWRANPVDLIAKGTGCPWCASSRGNRAVTAILVKAGVTFECEVRFDTCRHKIQLPFDFYLSEHGTLIEYDGEQHFKAIDYWGGEKGLEDRKKKDQIKTNWAEQNGYRLYRIRYDEELESRMESILREIQKLKRSRRPPSSE